MAQLELSPVDRDRLKSALIATLGNLETAAESPQELASKGISADDLKHTQQAYTALLNRLEALHFSIRTCAWCGTDFEAANPRKTTCSDACRQSLSRSKRGKLAAVTPQLTSSHSNTVTEATAATESHSDRDDRLPISQKTRPSIEGTLKGCHSQSVTIPPAPKGPRNRKVWFRLHVTVKLRPDGNHVVTKVYDHASCLIGYNNEPPVTETAFHDGFPEFTACVGRAGAGGAVFRDEWVFSFGMHVDGTPWIGDLEVPELVITEAQKLVTKSV